MDLKIAIYNNSLAKQQGEKIVSLLENIGHKCDLIVAKDSKKDSLQRLIESKKADLAVYSAKYLSFDHEMNTNFAIMGALKRTDHRDVVLTRKNESFLMLEKGSKVGVTSGRAECQLEINFPYFKVVKKDEDIINKVQNLDKKVLDAVITSQCDVKYLGLGNRIDEVLESDVMMPPLGQGVVAMECAVDNAKIKEIITQISDQETLECLKVERTIAQGLKTDYHDPIAGYCEYSGGGSLRVVAMVSSLDGATVIRSRMKEKDINPVLLGKRVIKHLQEQKVEELLKKN